MLADHGERELAPRLADDRDARPDLQVVAPGILLLDDRRGAAELVQKTVAAALDPVEVPDRAEAARRDGGELGDRAGHLSVRGKDTGDDPHTGQGAST